MENLLLFMCNLLRTGASPVPTVWYIKFNSYFCFISEGAVIFSQKK